MHESALIAGKTFAGIYGGDNKIVVDLGGRNVNGTLRPFFEKKNMKFICVDMEADPSVDIVVKPGERLPFEDNSVDIVVSTSCFEHDPCFWLTFREMTRIIKKDGYIYVNAPTHGKYHAYPGDNWRFYSDAGQALAYWSGFAMGNETVYPVKVIETFHITDSKWNDFICIWGRTDIKETNITISNTEIGMLEKKLNARGIITSKKC